MRLTALAASVNGATASEALLELSPSSTVRGDTSTTGFTVGTRSTAIADGVTLAWAASNDGAVAFAALLESFPTVTICGDTSTAGVTVASGSTAIADDVTLASGDAAEQACRYVVNYELIFFYKFGFERLRRKATFNMQHR